MKERLPPRANRPPYLAPSEIGLRSRVLAPQSLGEPGLFANPFEAQGKIAGSLSFLPRWESPRFFPTRPPPERWKRLGLAG